MNNMEDTACASYSTELLDYIYSHLNELGSRLSSNSTLSIYSNNTASHGKVVITIM